MMGGGMMGGFGSGFGSFGLIGGLIGLLLNIVILVGIVVLVVWAIQKFTRTSSPATLTGLATGQTPSAREILDARYARGELTREEYLSKLDDIL